jgi:hypothetical protein
MNNKPANVPLCETQIVPIHKHIQCKRTRKYVTHEQISLLAKERGKQGISLNDIMTNFACRKNQAQRKLKYMHSNGIIFTARDIASQGLKLTPSFKNKRPQRYYATAIKSDIIEKIKDETENVLIRTTVPNRSRHPLSNRLDYEKANSLFDVMLRLPWKPLYIHKIQVELIIDNECYQLIKNIPYKGNAGKYVEEFIDDTWVKYVYYKTGKVSVYVECSHRPFRIQIENDLAFLYSFLGQVRDRLEYHVGDPRGRLTPNITTWILKQCDFNKDVPISDKVQITLPDIQLSTALETFRLYVKNLFGEAFFRCEDSRQVNQPLTDYLNSTINPYPSIFARIQQLEKKIDVILDMKLSHN